MTSDYDLKSMMRKIGSNFRLRYGLEAAADELPIQDYESRFGSGSILKS